MIDWITMRLNGSFPGIGQEISVEQEKGYTSQSFTEETGRLYGDGALYYLQRKRAQTHEYLELRFCPPKILQGHNGLGSNDLIGVVKHSVRAIFKQQGLSLSRELKAQLKTGDYQLQEVHVTELLSMPHEAISTLCSNIRRYAPDSVQAVPIEKGLGIRLWPNSEERQIIIYDKVKYFSDKPDKHYRVLHAGTEPGGWNRHSLNSDFNDLLKYLRQGVRVECKLFSRYLKRHGLDRASAWSPEVARSEYLKVLQNVPLEDQPLADSIDLAIETAPLYLKADIALWKSGYDVRDFVPPSTFGRRKRRIQQLFGLEISRPVTPPFGNLTWTALIDKLNIVDPAPSDALASGFVFDPRKPQALSRQQVAQAKVVRARASGSP